MKTNKPGAVTQQPLFGCVSCYEDVSYPADHLHVYNGECWCESCWGEIADWRDWIKLEPFRPALEADYERLQADHERLQAEGDKLRACLAETAGVAVTMLYESHKADTIKEFTVEQLSQMVETTKHLADANVQVEKVYRKAWDMAHGCAGSYLEGAQP